MSVLSLQDVHSYYGTSHILQGVSLKVEEGETVALLGRNGAGKTTTMRSISGLVEPRQGSVIHNGKDITGTDPYKISRRGIKLVPEDRRVFPDLTVRDNLMIAKRQARAETRSIDEMYDIAPLLEPLDDRNADDLSGGEQQMLAVCRGLIQEPEVLMLDEPSEGLAPVIVENLQEIFKEVLAQDVTVLLSEQNVAFAMELIDRCYIIDKGKITYEGTVDELRKEKELMERYLAVTDF